MPKSCYKFFWKHIYEEIQFHEICKQTVCNFTKDWVKKMIGEGLKSLLCLLDFFYKCLKIWSFQSIFHCWKNVQIRSYFCLCFPVFSPNTGKYGPKMTPYLDTFLAVENIEVNENCSYFPPRNKYFLETRLLQWTFQISKTGTSSYLTRTVITNWGKFIANWGSSCYYQSGQSC